MPSSFLFFSFFLLFFSLQWVMIFKHTWPILKNKVRHVSDVSCLWVSLFLNWHNRRSVPMRWNLGHGQRISWDCWPSLVRGKASGTQMLLVLFGSRYPNWDYCKERGLEKDHGYKSIEKQASLVWLVIDHLTWTLRISGGGFSNLFVRASWAVLICSFTLKKKIKILPTNFSLNCFWQSDKQVKNRASS